MSAAAKLRRFAVPIAVFLALVLAAVVFRRELAGWITAGSKGRSVQGSSASVDHYTCPMHPSVNQKTPGKCPICGMALVPVTEEEQQHGMVRIEPARQQLIGVRTGAVVKAPMRETVRAVGLVSYDESALTDVSLRVRGWITKLYVSRTGERVARGQPLFDLYSPEVHNAEQDLVLALRGAAVERDAGAAEPGLAAAARERLRLLGVAESEIEAVVARGAPRESVTFASPASGFVIEKNAVEGAAVEAGTRVMRLAALGRVWIEADVYERDFASVHVGQAASVTLDYLPGRTFDAKVAYVYPYLDTASRTGRVRLELRNRDLDLRPGMYATVALTADLGDRVQVPASAVVYTGPRRIVFVDRGEGRFEPREVTLGVEANDAYEVLAGLEPGEVVATSGVFLIAAEARIHTAAQYWESDAGAQP